LLHPPALFLLFSASVCLSKDYAVYEANPAPALGKHIVLLSGDEEYRRSEALPQLAKILAERHGFKCTVLFSIDPTDQTINPNIHTNLPGADALVRRPIVIVLSLS